MPYKIPWSNFHELNLDWLLEQVKLLRTDVDDMQGAATPSDALPKEDGTAYAGSSINYSRGDHVHPTDTSRASASALTTETTDRQDADLLLSGRIDTLSARVVPSDAYPLMDGTAESGSNVEYSRRDHRHPTDTSRAAASDLTQEITDRGNADITLQTNIDTVDAKIKFSSTAPLMDSSSASPGFSDYQARADHIHPTDTSRASQSDFDTLKARVDAFEGSSNPSDATPLMDGVGAAGTGGNYSRGDHVHPSDTSKMDTAGGTFTGRVKNTTLEQYITVNATGWLRVATVPQVGGTLVRFKIMRHGALTPDEIHEISLAITQNSVQFIDELSKTDVVYVDKIRYTNAGKVDIHMDQTAESDIGVTIVPAAPSDTDRASITAVPIASVADAPVGETVLVVYNLSQASIAPGKYTLFSGWDDTGTITLADNIYNYDLLSLTAVTNVDCFSYICSPSSFYGNNWIFPASSGPIAGGYDFNSCLGIVPADGGSKLTISVSANNVNWKLHLYKVEGIKL